MSMLKSQKIKIGYSLALLLLGLLTLSACGGQPAADVKMYDFVYASGYSRDPYARDEVQPVIGTELQLRADNEGALQFLDAEGGLLYALADFQPESVKKSNLNLTVRAEAADKGVIMSGSGVFLPYAEESGEGAIWLCSEAWARSSYNGYVDGTLRGGRVLLLDAQTGSSVFSAETSPGELFLTAHGSRCYFYHPGKASRRKDDRLPAQIYWRDINFWPLTHTVCSFDYVGTPKYDGHEIERLRFYPQAEADGSCLRLDFTCYEQTNVENDRWDYVVQYSVDVPLTRQISAANPESPEEIAENAE